MGNSVIERDASSQKKFGVYLNTYCDNMRAACKSMLAHVTDARGDIMDPSGQVALAVLEEYAQAILDTLPGIQEFGQDQITRSQCIQKAEDYKFRR